MSDQAGAKVFISWGGSRSRAMGQAVVDWLGIVVQAAVPWYSPTDIAAGALWRTNLDEGLKDAETGVICVTPENQERPYVLFEAGALSKAIVHAEVAVCPLLLPGMESVRGPLSSFQAVRSSERDEVWKLARMISQRVNKARPLSDAQLQRSFDLAWESFSSAMAKIAGQPADGPRPMEPDKLDDVLRLVQSIDKGVANLQVRAIGDSVARRTAMLSEVVGRRGGSLSDRYISNVARRAFTDADRQRLAESLGVTSSTPRGSDEEKG